jgi:hypothetical protein
MNSLEAALRRVAVDLKKSGHPWALVGGFAVSARVEPRFTRDIDIAVLVDDDSAAEALVRSLISDGYAAFSSVEHDSGRLAMVRMRSARGDADVVVDLLFASSGIEAEIARTSESVEITPGLSVPVAAVGHLIAIKILARDDLGRPQDAADLRALRSVAGPEDLALAEEAVVLIEARGFNRGRDLRQAFSEFASS